MAYRPQRQHRYAIYKEAGFLPFEARELSGVRFAEAPYLRKLIRDRMRIREAFEREALFNKWSLTRQRREYRDIIRFEYLDKKWIREAISPRIGTPRYKASPWEMLKDYRQKAIERGEYHPAKGRRIRRVGDKIYIHIYKGDVAAQKERAREKLRASIGTPEYERYQRQRREQKARAKERKKREEQ